MGEGFFKSVCVLDYRGFCKNGGDCLKNILRKYVKIETVSENHVSNDTQKATSSSLLLEIVNLLNFFAIIMKE